MKNITELKAAIPASIKQDLYVKEVNGTDITTYFPNQTLVVMVKRLFNADPSTIVPDMSVARIIRKCEKLEVEGKLSSDVSGVTVKSVKTTKPVAVPVTDVTVGDEGVDTRNIVVTPVVPNGSGESAEPQGEAEPVPVATAVRQVNPLAFACKVALDEARGSDFAWCLSKGQMTRVSMVCQQKFGLDKEATLKLMDEFMSRFTKQYGRTTLLSPELLAWRYQECHFFITTSRGVFNYVVKHTDDGGDIYPADSGYSIKGQPRHFTNNWMGDMDPTIKAFFFSNLLLKEVR